MELVPKLGSSPHFTSLVFPIGSDHPQTMAQRLPFDLYEGGRTRQGTAMETLNDILEGFAITRWEAMFYAVLAGGCILMARYRSLLLITFVFTFYWGFRNLLEFLSFSEGLPLGAVILYVGSGVAMFGLVSVSYLME